MDVTAASERLIGREPELAEIEAFLERADLGALALEGEPGIGGREGAASSRRDRPRSSGSSRSRRSATCSRRRSEGSRRFRLLAAGRSRWRC